MTIAWRRRSSRKRIALASAGSQEAPRQLSPEELAVLSAPPGKPSMGPLRLMRTARSDPEPLATGEEAATVLLAAAGAAAVAAIAAVGPEVEVTPAASSA